MSTTLIIDASPCSPLGASGALVLTTLLDALEVRDASVGRQVRCEVGGLADATIIEPG
jgi:acetyl-CoA acyltransferase